MPSRHHDTTRHTHHPTVDFLFETVAVKLQTLLQRSSDLPGNQLDFTEVNACLNRLPLAMDEFALCRNRLSNAKAYAAGQEIGALRFELQQLARAVERQQTRYANGTKPAIAVC